MNLPNPPGWEPPARKIPFNIPGTQGVNTYPAPNPRDFPTRAQFNTAWLDWFHTKGNSFATHEYPPLPRQRPGDSPSVSAPHRVYPPEDAAYVDPHEAWYQNGGDTEDDEGEDPEIDAEEAVMRGNPPDVDDCIGLGEDAQGYLDFYD